ncbi:methylated-DNA--[protein]-cysteine S-methyltransferase [Rhizobium sp. L1K21]|uniref:methylated-DNA--[protein]-cysteine S-methyltransferase n=1 Tax=Rhizobium sp. L1K21 TaxID=2954933 RepID=UPI0020927751|nr:methylated-DNA--[protein]-cysteine S-methyltransferase [Rhizobium sp. L1K21]MCO6185078.1 methylated-DNA--[protein]-cysteine S-methyltransferase [Rhizobium sp. L1K21]
MAKSYYTLFETALGDCGIAWSQNGLTGVQLPDKTRSLSEARMRKVDAELWAGPLPDGVQAVTDQLVAYASGDAVDFSDVELDFSHLETFERAVYRALRMVARGETVTYGELAEKAGWPTGAAQSVGRAMARNPWPVIVPCHRVLAAGNKPGGFSAPGGLKTKEKLLAMEGVYLDGGAPLLPGLFG